MQVDNVIQISGFVVIIFSIFFSRRDRGEDKLERALDGIRKSFNKDICLLFEKIDNMVSDKLCKERRENIQNDVNNLGELIRSKDNK